MFYVICTSNRHINSEDECNSLVGKMYPLFLYILYSYIWYKLNNFLGKIYKYK